MSIAIHATAHAQIQVRAEAHQPARTTAPARPAAPIVRDHREPTRAPIVTNRERDDHDSRGRGADSARDRDHDRDSDHDRDRDRDHDRDSYRPVIVRPTPVAIAPSYSAWTPAPSYTIQSAAIQLLWPTALASDSLSIETGSLGYATRLELDAAGRARPTSRKSPSMPRTAAIRC